MLIAKDKIKYIEGIRGLAAIIVVLHHYTLAFYPALNFGDSNQTNFGNGSHELLFANTPLNLIYNGGFAVSVFFILSGFVLSNAYHQSQNPNMISSYAIKRYVRLFVPVSVTIIISYIFIKAGFMTNSNLGEITKSRDWLNGAFTVDLGIYDVIKNMFIDVFFIKDNKYNPVLWTMTYELLGSFLLFAFLLIIHPLKNKNILFITLICVLFFTKNEFYAAFILGAFLNKNIIHNDVGFLKLFLKNHFLFLYLLLGIFFCSYPLCNTVNHTMYQYITFSFLNNYDFYHVIGAFIIMVVVLHSDKLKQFFSLQVLSYIGKISFSFYLLHFIVLCSFSCYAFKQFFQFYGYNVSVLFAFLCSLPIIILSSICFYKWVDKFGIKLSEKFLALFVSKNERL